MFLRSASEAINNAPVISPWYMVKWLVHYMICRPRQTLLCSIITDSGGELSWFCQLAAPTVWWFLWGTAGTKSKSSTFLWAGDGHKWLAHKDERNYVYQSFVATHTSGKCAVSTRSYQRHVARKSKPPPFPGSVGHTWSYEWLVY